MLSAGKAARPLLLAQPLKVTLLKQTLCPRELSLWADSARSYAPKALFGGSQSVDVS